jgi:protein MpaA
MHTNIKYFYLVLIFIAVALIYFYGVPYVRHFLLHFDTKKLYSNLEESPVPWQIIAESTEGRNIYLLEIGNDHPTTLIFAAFHGNEQTGFHLAVQLAESLYANPGQIKGKAVIVPVVNPDGLMARTRTNANGVDINRNFPTDNWSPAYKDDDNRPGYAAGSEKETQVVIQLLERYKPDKIITIHTPLKVNNFDGPAEDLASEMARYNHYPVKGDIGYPTPGSFGTFAGVELKIPTVTLELPDISPEKAWDQNYEALIQAINF